MTEIEIPTDDELNRFCAEKIMKWKEMWYLDEPLWGPDDDTIMVEGEVDFLTNPVHNEMLLEMVTLLRFSLPLEDLSSLFPTPLCR